MKKVVFLLAVLAIMGAVFQGAGTTKADASDISRMYTCYHMTNSSNTFVISTRYPNADNYGHQAETTTLYRCYKCGYSEFVSEKRSESHSINASTKKCVCGFQPR